MDGAPPVDPTPPGLTDPDDLDEVREMYTGEAHRASQTQYLFDIVDDGTGTFNTVLTSLDLGQVTPEVRDEFAGQPLGQDATVTVEIEGHQWRIRDHQQLQVYYLDRGLGPISVYRWTQTLAKVRRLLANVPTYMSPDDHEVTDDWNFRQEWRDRVYTTLLGRVVIRNGIVAYALFQGWGSDPQRFTSGPNKELLDRVEELFPLGSTKGPNATAAARIETLLGLDGGDPPVRWHFTAPGTSTRVGLHPRSCCPRTPFGSRCPAPHRPGWRCSSWLHLSLSLGLRLWRSSFSPCPCGPSMSSTVPSNRWARRRAPSPRRTPTWSPALPACPSG